MRVLLSAGMIQRGRSGVGRYVVSIAEALHREDPEVELHVAGLDDDRELFPWMSDQRWWSIPAGGAVRNLWWHQRTLPGLLAKGRFRCVHIPSYRRMLAFSPVAQVATIHDCAPFVLREKYDASRGFFGRVVVPPIARRVERIVAVSGTTAKDIGRFMGVDPSRLRTLPNGIDHARFRPQAVGEIEAFRDRKKLDRPFLLYVARLEHPAKNHVRLIEAFERLVAEETFRGDLVLPGADWHGAEVVRSWVAASPCRERIRLEGFVDEGDLPRWYAAAEALVFPSLMEGFGLPLLEAQACGTRVAAADATSLPEVAGPASLLFDPVSVDSMVEVLRKLSTMPAEERARREAEGREWAAGFTWSAHVAGLVEVYREAVEERS